MFLILIKMIPILVYTHSEYSFLWKAAIPLLERYAKDFQIIWCCDTLLDYKIPSSWILYIYNPLLSWGFRVKGCLETINSDYVLYIQEDMLLIDHVVPEKIEHCLEFMNHIGCEFLMSYPNNIREGSYSSNYDNYIFIKIFSHYMQPGIWKKSLLHEICSLNVAINENESEKCFTISKNRNCYATYNIRHEKDISTRSLFFPHMHTIVQGKWTFFKYPCLKALIEAHGIDTSTREIDTSWLTGHQ
jgi:hypothetical protein